MVTRAHTGGNGRRIPPLRAKEYAYGYAYIAPMAIGFFIFLVLPLIATFYYSGTNYSLLTGKSDFVGLDNYVKMFTADPKFIATAKNTLYFSVLFVPLSIGLSLGLAVMLNNNFKGVGLFRTIFFTPYVTSIAVWGIVWRFIFQTDNGLINMILRLVFEIDGPQWLYSEGWAIPILAITTALKGIGMNMIIFLTALKAVPAMYMEAADLDGATGFSRFIHITLPLISPTVFLNVVVGFINSLKVFGMVNTLTLGGPGVSSHVFVYYIYQVAFKQFKFGYACAVAVVMFAIVMILTLLQWSMKKRWVFYED